MTDPKRQVKVRVRLMYGREIVEARCDTGRIFMQIAGTRTLTRHMLIGIAKLGYEILEEPMPIPSLESYMAAPDTDPRT